MGDGGGGRSKQFCSPSDATYLKEPFPFIRFLFPRQKDCKPYFTIRERRRNGIINIVRGGVVVPLVNDCQSRRGRRGKKKQETESYSVQTPGGFVQTSRKLNKATLFAR